MAHDKVFVVFDKTDKNFKKPFYSIHMEEDKAQAQVDKLSKGLPDHSKRLVFYEAVKIDEVFRW